MKIIKKLSAIVLTLILCLTTLCFFNSCTSEEISSIEGVGSSTIYPVYVYKVEKTYFKYFYSDKILENEGYNWPEPSGYMYVKINDGNGLILHKECYENANSQRNPTVNDDSPYSIVYKEYDSYGNVRFYSYRLGTYLYFCYEGSNKPCKTYPITVENRNETYKITYYLPTKFGLTDDYKANIENTKVTIEVEKTGVIIHYK
jgi:hypothetical protein